MVSVTVGICTFNRAELLDQTLETLSRINVPDDATWEVIVVNNNSTDETPEIVARHLSHLPLRLIDEPVAGLSAARNRVIREATGELIIFIDDDVMVDCDWLAEYVRAAREWPHAHYFGGTVRAHFAVDPPKWVLRNSNVLAEPYSLAEHGSQTQALDSMKIVGANMAFRSWVLKQHSFN